MYRFLIWTVILVSIFFTACDRFDNDFTTTVTTVTLSEFVQDYAGDARTALQTGDLPSIMSFYTENYLNNGMTKAQLQQFFQSKNWSDSLKVVTTILNADSMKISVHIQDNQVRYDTTIVDYAVPAANSFKFRGNQKDNVTLPKQVAFIELLTGLSCVNCPAAEDRLHELKQQYGDRVIYIEYHTNDPLDCGNSDINTYFTNPAQPTAIFQGLNVLTGGPEVDNYETVLESYLNQNAQVQMSNLAYTIEGNTVKGSVKIQLSGALQSHLYLKYALIEQQTSFNNMAGNPCLRAVRKKGKTDLSTADLGQTLQFELALPANITDAEKDLSLVVWVQTITDVSTQNPQSDKIYNAMEIPLVIAK